MLMKFLYTWIVLFFAQSVIFTGGFVESASKTEILSTNQNSNLPRFNLSVNASMDNFQSFLSAAGNTSIRWFVIDLTNETNSHTENETSKNVSIISQHNETYIELCHKLYNEDGCMLSSAVVVDLSNLFHVFNTNGTSSHNTKVASKISATFQERALRNLTEAFNCVLEETVALNISCTDVIDIYSIGEYLPNNTVVLDISFSFQIILSKPLCPHLKSLKRLTLSNNHHRYITKAFMGLDSLEELNLSNNDIIVLLKAFSYVPKLKVLDLSGNGFTRAEVISNAVSYLKDLRNLHLDHNYHISYLTKKDLSGLKNCKIEILSIFNTTIRYVERGAFSSMNDLKVLDISVNYMNEIDLANITCNITETVETLYAQLLLNLKSFPYDALYCLRNTKLNALYLGENYIRLMPVIPSLPNLRVFSMPNSSLEIIEANAFQNVPKLETINLRCNKLSIFPRALSSLQYLKDMFIDLQISDYEFQKFFIPDYAFQNLTCLDTLRLTLLHIENLSRYCLHGLRNLKRAHMSLLGLYHIEDYAFETLTSLAVLDLRGNGISSLSNFTFFGLHSLQQLYLNSNKIKFVSSIYPLQHCPSLNAILMQNNVIRTIPMGMFSNLDQLLVLSMANNRIIPWQEKIFHPNASLKILGLAENNIDFISDAMLAEFRQVTEYLDLNKNPFNCSKCGMKNFQIFYQNSNLTFGLPLPETKDFIYVCVNPEPMLNKPFLEVELLACEDIYSEVLSLIALLLISIFLSVAILVASLCYAFRWYIRYGIFRFKTNFIVRNDVFRDKGYTFDAFIIYNSVDTPWVVEHLMPHLEEEEPRYKLCVHQRDFKVGKPITENILEAIESSHKVILILTAEFIKSDWCMYELHLAQHKLFDDTRDTLILVKLKTIDRKLYTKNVSYIEKTRKCYMWTDSHIGQRLFWEQIRKQLGPPSSKPNSSWIAL